MSTMIMFILNFCICQLVHIWVHACCHSNQLKPPTLDSLVATAAVHSTSIVWFLALGPRLPFESKCDKYWMLSVNTFHATCLLDYIDCSYSLTQLTPDKTKLLCDSQLLQISVYHSFARLRGWCQALVTQLYWRRVTRSDLALRLLPTSIWLMIVLCISKELSDWWSSYLQSWYMIQWWLEWYFTCCVLSHYILVKTWAGKIPMTVLYSAWDALLDLWGIKLLFSHVLRQRYSSWVWTLFYRRVKSYPNPYLWRDECFLVTSDWPQICGYIQKY